MTFSVDMAHVKNSERPAFIERKSLRLGKMRQQANRRRNPCRERAAKAKENYFRRSK